MADIQENIRYLQSSERYPKINRKPVTDPTSQFSCAEYNKIVESLDEIAKGNVSGKIDVDSSISSTSTNPVQNKVVYEQLSKKQDKLVSGTSIKTINGESVIGSGNINTKSECDTFFSVVNGAVCITYNT